MFALAIPIVICNDFISIVSLLIKSNALHDTLNKDIKIILKIIQSRKKAFLVM